MTVLSSTNGDTSNNYKSPSAIYGLLLVLTVIITASEFLLFLSFDFELRQLLYLAAIAIPLLTEAAHKHLSIPTVQKILPHVAFLGVFFCFSSQLFADINAYNLIPVIGLVMLIIWYRSLSGISHWVALGATLVLAVMLIFFAGIPIESAIVDSLLVLTPIAYFSAQAWFSYRGSPASMTSEFDSYHQDMPVTDDVFAQELAQVDSGSEQDWPRVLRELQGELRNITDVDRLFKTLLLFMSGAIEVDAAAVGMIQERSIKKIARIGDEQLSGASELQWTGDRIKRLLAAGGEVIENAVDGELSRVDIPLLSNHKAQGVVTLFRRNPFTLSESRLASSIVSQGMLLLKLARLQDEVRKSGAAHKGKSVLLSREQFIDQSGNYIEKLKTPRVFSLLIIEIDKFEDQLQNQGHDVKTAVYKKISALIMSELQEADLAGRYGNDGFMVLLNETDLLDAKKVAETIKDKVAMTKHNTPDGALTLTVSIGLTTTSEELDDMPALIRKADMGLFVAKESGYNSVKVSL